MCTQLCVCMKWCVSIEVVCIEDLCPLQLMSVRVVMEDVIRSVRILFLHSTASVEMDLLLIWMEEAVMVMNSLQLTDDLLFTRLSFRY